MFNKKRLDEMNELIHILIKRTDEQIKKNDTLNTINEFLIEETIKLTIADTIIKKCPFCNCKPKIMHTIETQRNYPFPEIIKLCFKMGCKNPDCKVHPTTILSTSLDEVIINWNAWEAGKR